MVGLVTKRITEHLADSGEFVLTVERKHHAKETIELRTFHALPKEEHIFGECLLVLGRLQIHLAAEGAGVANHEIGLLLDRGDVFKHRLTLVRVDAERADHVNQRVGVDVFLVGMAAKH